MGLEYGLTANREVPTDVRTSGISQIPDVISTLQNSTQVGRVKDIILNDKFPEIEKYGGYSAIGSIFFTVQGFKSGGFDIAKPLFPQSTYYPLKEELVYILHLPDTSIGEQDSNKSFYYLNVINVWNAPNHNAFPEEKVKDIARRQNEYENNNLTNSPQINSTYPPYDDDKDIFESDLNLNQNTFFELRLIVFLELNNI